MKKNTLILRKQGETDIYMEHIRRTDRELVYKGSMLEFYRDTMLTSDGKVSYWDHIEHKGAAAMVPVLEDGRIILVRQYRNSPDEETLEIPAGGINTGESVKYAAMRELEEETGYRADEKNVKKLISIITAVAFCNEVVDIYVADNLEKTCQHLDEEESINVEIYTLDDIKSMIFNGEIKDSKTISAILAYSEMLRK